METSRALRAAASGGGANEPPRTPPRLGVRDGAGRATRHSLLKGSDRRRGGVGGATQLPRRRNRDLAPPLFAAQGAHATLHTPSISLSLSLPLSFSLSLSLSLSLSFSFFLSLSLSLSLSLFLPPVLSLSVSPPPLEQPLQPFSRAAEAPRQCRWGHPAPAPTLPRLGPPLFAAQGAHGNIARATCRGQRRRGKRTTTHSPPPGSA